MDALSTLIGRVRRRWFAAAGLQAAGRALAAAAAPLAAGLAAYWILAPSGTALLVLAGAAALLSIAAAVIVALRIERRPDDVRVARFIEERVEAAPGARSMDDCVVSAVQAVSPRAGEHALLAPLVVQSALRRLEGIDATAIVPPAVIRRAALAAAGGAVLLAATLLVGAPALLHAVETARLKLFPASISVDVVPGDVRVVAGQPLTIRARVHARGGALGRTPPSLVVSAADAERTVAMVPAGDGFTFAFESVDRSFRYRVTAGAAASADYAVTALFAPRVERIDLHYVYPSFSGLAPRSDDDGGDIFAPAGTRVRVRVHADKPVAAGRLAMSRSAPAMRVAADDVLEADLVVGSDDSYRIRLVDRDGLAADDESEYFIRVMQDRPPEVRILRPSGDQGITPLQEVPIEARAEDDYGVASLDLVYSVAGGPERRVPFGRVSATATDRTGSHLLAAEELGVRPGDVIAYYAAARDVGRGRPSTEVTSDLFFLEVKPFNEEFVAAQSQAGGGAAGDPQLEALIDAQKNIISATWNIERRSAGGRSADDVRAVAKAQADLKARVERMLAGARGQRIRPPAPQRIQALIPQPRPAGAPDPVAAAVDAMTRAMEQLSSARTREAIPHEMAALNGLLQAQAEVRRRQIAQQQARGGGGGGNRQSQDLSALFDKELQRQQQTNYEQRSQVEERQEQQQGTDQELLDRIRDLAQRQEALNRQQQEAARQQAEERKRQLERLAREQEELQRQVDELSKQMGRPRPSQQGEQQGQQGQQQGQQQAQGQQQGQSQGAGSAGARASDQMRRAADEMRRENSDAAAQSGARAAEALRTLEQGLRGSGAEARQRAAADLQAEAQQVAQEQRRIAAEAERMEKGGDAGSTDARRRLAADKDRLADRVDNLRQAAERMGADARRGTAAGGEQARAREAAGELQKQRVGERMREGAQALRDGASPASAQGEQQIAQTLERVVEKLGGAAAADAQRLAEQLDRSRAARERLDALEGQLREAERRGDGTESARLREQYQQELARAREAFGQPSGPQPQPGGARTQEGSRGSTPEQQEASRSAPGTEAFKQDRSGWESLRKDVDRALEQHDADVSRRLARTLGEDRLNAGGSERIPEHYRRLVARYYESLARMKQP
jgi:hypothetical protein